MAGYQKTLHECGHITGGREYTHSGHVHVFGQANNELTTIYSCVSIRGWFLVW